MGVATDKLSEEAQRLLSAIQGVSQEWLTRREIAALVKRNQLNAYQTAALDLLANQGKIIVERRNVPGGIGFALYYKATQEGE